MTFGLEPPARAHPVEIAIYVQLQQIARRVTWPAHRHRLDPLETRGLQIEPVDEGVDEPHGVVAADIIINRLRQKQELRAFGSGNVRHTGFYRGADANGIPSVGLFTRSARFPHLDFEAENGGFLREAACLGYSGAPASFHHAGLMFYYRPYSQRPSTKIQRCLLDGAKTARRISLFAARV